MHSGEPARRRPMKGAGGFSRKDPMQRKRMAQQITPRLEESRRQYREDAQPVVLVRDGFACTRCGYRVEATHHRRPRGMGGSSRRDDTHSPASLICLCDGCHAWVEQARTESTALGYLVPMGIDPEDWPIWWGGQWCLLTAGGTVLMYGSTRPTTPATEDPQT